MNIYIHDESMEDFLKPSIHLQLVKFCKIPMYV